MNLIARFNFRQNIFWVPWSVYPCWALKSEKSEKIKFLARNMFKNSRNMLVYAHRNEPFSKGQLSVKIFFGSHGQFTRVGLLRVKKNLKNSSFWFKQVFQAFSCAVLLLWGHLVIWNVIFHKFHVLLWDLWHYANYSYNKMWFNALWNIQEYHWVKHAFLVLFLVSCGHLAIQNVVVHILIIIWWC